LRQAILTLNSGSSSIKFALFRTDQRDLANITVGKIEAIGLAPRMKARDGKGQTLIERHWENGAALSHEVFLGELLDWLESQLEGSALIGVGHRVVHGGVDFYAPLQITDTLLGKLDALSPLAPLHQPHNLAAIRAITAMRPQLPQIACFDTAFHHDQPAVATRFGLPRALEQEGVRRYGFHGISYEYIARRLAELDPALAKGRVIAAHLGNGASLCAMLDGRSMDTTMGFTALDGLMMGTRCGALDPGVLLYLLQQKGMSAKAIEHLLYSESGLLGVSGISSDMRELLANPDPRAKEAVDLFTYRIARETAALTGALGGLDGLVFTAGIGENSPEVRALACQRLAWMGIELDDARNRANASVISTPQSRVTVHVIPTDEERMIAMHTLATLGRTTA